MEKLTMIHLPKGLNVKNASPRGINSIGQFENKRFEIVITSNDGDLVNYDTPSDSLLQFGNYYSADKKMKRLIVNTRYNIG